VENSVIYVSVEALLGTIGVILSLTVVMLLTQIFTGIHYQQHFVDLTKSTMYIKH